MTAKTVEFGDIPMATSLTFMGYSAPPETGDVILKAVFDVPLANLFRGQSTFEDMRRDEAGQMMADRNATVVFGVTRQQLRDCDRADAMNTWPGELQWHDFVLVQGSDGQEVMIEVQVGQIVLPNPLGTPRWESPRIIIGSVRETKVALLQKAA